MNIYERIDGSKYRNIWVVGDLHGCYTNLMNKLDTIGFDNKKDLLISVGDLVDRGAENVECLELITFPWFRAVRGNHEQMMIDGLSERGNVNHWLLNGGGWFFNLDYDKEILAKALAHKAEELPLIIELVSKGKKYVICHADYPCDEYEFGKPVDHQQVIWNRERISNSQDGIVKEIKGADTFIFGHTPAVKPLKFANQMYIDTGAVFCGNLTLIQVQGEGAWAYPTTSQPDMVRQVGSGKNFPGDAMKRGYVTVNLGSDFDASTIKKGDPVYVVVSTDESIKVPLGGFMSTSVSGKNVALTNAEFTGAGDADGNAEISWKI